MYHTSRSIEKLSPLALYFFSSLQGAWLCKGFSIVNICSKQINVELYWRVGHAFDVWCSPNSNGLSKLGDVKKKKSTHNCKDTLLCYFFSLAVHVQMRSFIYIPVKNNYVR